jgi:hypothetical protein
MSESKKCAVIAAMDHAHLGQDLAQAGPCSDESITQRYSRRAVSSVK